MCRDVRRLEGAQHQPLRADGNVRKGGSHAQLHASVRRKCTACSIGWRMRMAGSVRMRKPRTRRACTGLSPTRTLLR
ncbi:hypothetical protein CU044_6961 [Streptomyces sp. L-9-10]|nr:hypothetical protein CU044_6961 [Streptomyces sp. L-9-10]